MLLRQGNVEPLILLIGFFLWEVVAELLVECWEPSSRIAVVVLKGFQTLKLNMVNFCILLSNGKFISKGSMKLGIYEEAMCSFSVYLNSSKFPGHIGILDLAMTFQQDTLIDLDFASKYVTKPMKAMSQETSWSRQNQKVTQVVQVRLNKRCPRVLTAFACSLL